MSDDTISKILTIVLVSLVCIFFILLISLVIIRRSQKNKEKEIENVLEDNQEKKPKKKSKPTTTGNTIYNKQSIMDFMEFDKIEDNMIVQKKGKRFLMVVECQGVNYDLMSNIEKVSVEEGFQQFLNTLRHPIQIYIQTRTINLENSINTYKSKIKEIEDKYNQMMYRYDQIRNSGTATKQEIQRYQYEIVKQRNLLEYGRDLVSNTEKMSLNRNVLNKKYYIIIPYLLEETSDIKYDYEEIKNIAFSELYTKSQSIIRTLSSCSVNGKILSSQELVDLMYVAYNRDESEVFGLNKALDARYDELYTTSANVYEKKIKVLDELVEKNAIQMANEAIEKVKSRPRQVAEEKEEALDELVRKMAALVLDENRQYVGEDTAKEAIKEIEKSETKEGGEVNEQSEKTTTRGRKKKTVS